MVLRSAVGALATVAIIAAVAAALPEKGSTTPGVPGKQPSFGDLAKPGFAPGQAALPKTATPSADLLKLASFNKAGEPVQQVVPPPTVRVVSLAAPSVQPSVQPAAPATDPRVAGDPSRQPSATLQNIHVATAAPVPASEAPAAAAPAPQPLALPNDANKPQPGTLVDINTASVDLLDRLPGAGRIGRAIASRRPYGSVEDLVRKRVLREGAFQRIRPYIAAN